MEKLLLSMLAITSIGAAFANTVTFENTTSRTVMVKLETNQTQPLTAAETVLPHMLLVLSWLPTAKPGTQGHVTLMPVDTGHTRILKSAGTGGIIQVTNTPSPSEDTKIKLLDLDEKDHSAHGVMFKE